MGRSRKAYGLWNISKERYGLDLSDTSRGGWELIPLMTQFTKPGSLYYTDDWHAYTFLDIRGDHVVIRKEKGRRKGRDHINGIEGFWPYAKHCLYHYRGVPRKYFHLYLKEIGLSLIHI